MVVVVLDEMDNLVTKDQEVLYNLFQLAAYQHSTVPMFGVANSIDLVHRGGMVVAIVTNDDGDAAAAAAWSGS